MNAYLERLHQAHRMETGGEAAYAAAARLSLRAEDRAKWLVLASLESRTKERLAGAIRDLGGSAGEARFERWLGAVSGVVLAFLPRRAALRALRATSVRAALFWRRLEREYPEGDALLLAALTAHERAQSEFAERELAGDPETSLEPAARLLG